MLRQCVLGGLVALTVAAAAAHGAPIRIVAAENFYGDVARQIGGPDVLVTSILNNPDQDPHLFELTPSAGRIVSGAQIAIYNGIDYDPWMQRLLRATPSAGRRTIVVADLMSRKSGDNPHIWYEPAAMVALARSLYADLAADDPAHKAGYAQRLAAFTASVRPIEAKIADLRRRVAGAPVTATEPIFGYMFDALGMRVKDLPFQMAVMNNTEPSPSAIAAFEADLRGRQVRLLIYNSQAADLIADRMERLARASHVPVVGATETEPAGLNYQAWMMSELDAVDRALSRPAP